MVEGEEEKSQASPALFWCFILAKQSPSRALHPTPMPFSSHWLSTLERALDLLHRGHYDEALLAFDEVCTLFDRLFLSFSPRSSSARSSRSLLFLQLTRPFLASPSRLLESRDPSINSLPLGRRFLRGSRRWNSRPRGGEIWRSTSSRSDERKRWGKRFCPKESLS